MRQRLTAFAAIAVLVAVGFGFYFFVDVVDHQHAYVGWRAGHLLFIAMAPLVGLLWEDATKRGGATRAAVMAALGLLAVAAAPTTAIDLYNTQDTANQHQGPGFRWTEILSPGEVDALAWLANTPESALVQVDHPPSEPGPTCPASARGDGGRHADFDDPAEEILRGERSDAEGVPSGRPRSFTSRPSPSASTTSTSARPNGPRIRPLRGCSMQPRNGLPRSFTTTRSPFTASCPEPARPAVATREG